MTTIAASFQTKLVLTTGHANQREMKEGEENRGWVNFTKTLKPKILILEKNRVGVGGRSKTLRKVVSRIIMF